MRVCRIATRLKRNMRKYSGITIGILQVHVEGVDIGDFLPRPHYSLGFSYRASSVRVTMRITNRCNYLFYVFLSFFSSLPYMFRAFISPSSGVSQAVICIQKFGSCSVYVDHHHKPVRRHTQMININTA